LVIDPCSAASSPFLSLILSHGVELVSLVPQRRVHLSRGLTSRCLPAAPCFASSFFEPIYLFHLRCCFFLSLLRFPCSPSYQFRRQYFLFLRSLLCGSRRPFLPWLLRLLFFSRRPVLLAICLPCRCPPPKFSKRPFFQVIPSSAALFLFLPSITFFSKFLSLFFMKTPRFSP